jgi:hypothetical protein
VECGEHYYRPMSVWTVLTALLGLRYRVETYELEIVPAIQGIVRLPIIFTNGWGILSRSFRKDTICYSLALSEGFLRVSKLVLGVVDEKKPKEVAVAIEKKSIETRIGREKEGLALHFIKQIELLNGEEMTVTIIY